MKVTITALTPIHIGTGRELQGNNEYLWFDDTRQAVAIDEEAVLGIIGEENIGQWVSCIENQQSLMQLLRQRNSNLKAGDVAKRVIDSGGTVMFEQKALREQLHSGNGQPIIPGSSLKGSIRTAVWATIIRQHPELVKNEGNLGNTDNRGNLQFKDGLLAQKVFGKDPNHDIFRLIQVGDAAFEHTKCYLTEVANFSPSKNEWILDKDIQTQVEAIPAGQESSLTFRYNETMEKSARDINLFNGYASLLRPEKLFPSINAHTRQLIESEIKYWRGDGGMPQSIGGFVDEMEKILQTIQTSNANTCILRLGYGTGFRNMTGDWHINLSDDDYYDLVKQVRPTHPEALVFPKTTRFVSGGVPMGFLKLTILKD